MEPQTPTPQNGFDSNNLFKSSAPAGAPSPHLGRQPTNDADQAFKKKMIIVLGLLLVVIVAAVALSVTSSQSAQEKKDAAAKEDTTKEPFSYTVPKGWKKIEKDAISPQYLTKDYGNGFTGVGVVTWQQSNHKSLVELLDIAKDGLPSDKVSKGTTKQLQLSDGLRAMSGQYTYLDGRGQLVNVWILVTNERFNDYTFSFASPNAVKKQFLIDMAALQKSVKIESTLPEEE